LVGAAPQGSPANYRPGRPCPDARAAFRLLATHRGGSEGCRSCRLSSGGLPIEIEGEEAFEDLGVAGVRRPAVGGEDSSVKIVVEVREPGRALVAEVRQGPLREVLGGEAGWVRPPDPRFTSTTNGVVRVEVCARP
jgi:hypothetical protein